MPDLPHAAVVDLPAFESFTVDPSRVDVRGHMNIRYYFDACARAILSASKIAGLDDAYRESSGCDGFTGEHHVAYWSELRLGDAYSTRARVLARSAKAFAVMAFVVDDVRERIVCTLESTLVHVDLSTRKAVAIPDSITKRLDYAIAQVSEIPRAVPEFGRLRPAP